MPRLATGVSICLDCAVAGFTYSGIWAENGGEKWPRNDHPGSSSIWRGCFFNRRSTLYHRFFYQRSLSDMVPPSHAVPSVLLPRDVWPKLEFGTPAMMFVHFIPHADNYEMKAVLKSLIWDGLGWESRKIMKKWKWIFFWDVLGKLKPTTKQRAALCESLKYDAELNHFWQPEKKNFDSTSIHPISTQCNQTLNKLTQNCPSRCCFFLCL